MNQFDTIGIDVRGRHASQETLRMVTDETGVSSFVRNHSTRIDSKTTTVSFMSSCAGTVCLRVDDIDRLDFWLEFNLDIPTLERLLAEAKMSKDESVQ
jgi:hypothetical protein